MTTILCFDIETIPDVIGLRASGWFDDAPDDGPDAGHDDGPGAGLDDDAIVARAFERQQQKGGSRLLPLYLQRVAAISVLEHDGSGPSLRSLGRPEDDERTLVQSFYRLIDNSTPQLVSWNGGGFDLQVLQYRALINGVYATRYWEQGERDREFRFDNYLNRYHARHLDLMDLLALYTPRANAPLDTLARLCGFPGKLGMDGSQVWPAWRQGRIGEIRAYCETDVANTWLLYCRFQAMRGAWARERYEAEIAGLRAFIEQEAPGARHWREFLAAWDESQKLYRSRRAEPDGAGRAV